MCDFARERDDAQEHAERNLLDGDPPPALHELMPAPVAQRRPGPPFHKVVEERQAEGRNHP